MGDKLSRLRPDAVASLLRQLREVAAADPEASELARMLIAPLAREDGLRGNNLIATLRAYYESGARVDRTASALFLHRNSVRYRLDRVRTLVGVNIDEPHVIAALTVALACHERAAQERTYAG